MSELLWTPSPERISQANLTAFIQHCREQAGAADVCDFPSLYQWSIDDPEAFWPAVWTFCNVISSRGWDAVAIDRDRMPGTTWFPGARLNFAENLLRRRDDQPALIFWNEQGRQRELSFHELARETARVANWLRSVGVTAGDRVAGFMPNMPETVIAMLATASLGAIWSSTSPDFGEQSVLDRFGQIEPKVLFTAAGYFYNGVQHNSLPVAAAVAKALPSLKHVVVAGYPSDDAPLDEFPSAVRFNELPSTDADAPHFEQLPFDHPLYILYSSGTTGVPKCIVHGAGGTLLQHLKELVLHTNLKPGDRILYFTTCGWMMWNWLVSSLAVGATVVLYDGSPLFPRPDILFDLAEQERLTVFGTSARYLSAIEKEGVAPQSTHDLSSVRTLLSTGSPLAASSFDYVYTNIKQDVCLSSISGGTDIVSCFALGNPIGPVYRGELQTRGLGMKVQVYDDHGRPVRRGEQGELVCTAPFPSMPIGFWNDPQGEKYHAAYFEYFPGVWRHGDLVELTERDGMIVYGRSDTVLNPGGVRIGTGEIYRQTEQVPEILESVVIAQEWDGDTRIVLFVKLRDGVQLDAQLTDRIKTQIRRHASPRHVPRVILQVADIPRTRSGKIAELAVRDVVHNRPVKNSGALANPEALELFRDRPELR